jgi:hypothetical protein
MTPYSLPLLGPLVWMDVALLGWFATGCLGQPHRPHQPSAAPAWTMRYLAVHAADSLARLPTEITHARRSRE